MVYESYSSKATGGGVMGRRGRERGTKGVEIAVEKRSKPVFLSQQENRAAP